MYIGHRGDERSTSNSPTSYHTPNNLEDSDYQEDIDHEVREGEGREGGLR